MSGWVTHVQAAELLGVHESAIPKMVSRGDLTPRDKAPSLSRDQVVALAEERARPKEPKPPRAPSPLRVPQPPDREHVWLNSDEAATLLGLGRSGVSYRVQRGLLPNELHDGRRWFRLDLLELAVRAQVARTRREVPSPSRSWPTA